MMEKQDMENLVRLRVKGLIMEFCAQLVAGRQPDSDRLISDIEQTYNNPDISGLPIDIKQWRKATAPYEAIKSLTPTK